MSSCGDNENAARLPAWTWIGAGVAALILVMFQVAWVPSPAGLWSASASVFVFALVAVVCRAAVRRESVLARGVVSQMSLRTEACEAAGVGMIIADAGGRIVWVNRAFAELTGFGQGDWTGRMRDQLLSGAHPDTSIADVGMMLRAGGASWSGVGERRRSDGSVYHEALRITAIRDLAGLICHHVGVVSNVSGALRIESELRDSNRTLGRELESRMDQLSIAARDLEMFAYAVSHDLRAPLRAIDFFGHELKDGYEGTLDATAMGHLGRILAARHRMAQMIDGLMALFHLGRGELRVTDIDLSGVSLEIIDGLRREYPGRTVDVTVHPGMQVRGDIRLVQAAMSNLIGNAWKFTSKKAVAKIEVGRVMTEVETACFVRDDGVGFDMAYADRLFTTIRRLHTQDEFEGNGIGLVSVYRVVQRHHGRLWVEAAEGKGATFYFTLGPAADAVRPNPASDVAPAVPGGHR